MVAPQQIIGAHEMICCVPNTLFELYGAHEMIWCATNNNSNLFGAHRMIYVPVNYCNLSYISFQITIKP